MQRNINKIIGLFLFLNFASCTTQSPLEYALNQAGDNRAELEKVLTHYKGTRGTDYDYKHVKYMYDKLIKGN